MFDEIMRVSAQQSTQNYPPYNVVKHTDDKFVIELAVAGFREGDITVTVEKNLLTIEGDRFENETETSVEYLHRGISSRSFTRTFTLADHVEVVDASSTDGILSITLERKVPEELQPKKIAIAYNK
jgi:molecular chaperone IbpA